MSSYRASHYGCIIAREELPKVLPGARDRQRREALERAIAELGEQGAAAPELVRALALAAAALAAPEAEGIQLAALEASEVVRRSWIPILGRLFTPDVSRARRESVAKALAAAGAEWAGVSAAFLSARVPVDAERAAAGLLQRVARTQAARNAVERIRSAIEIGSGGGGAKVVAC